MKTKSHPHSSRWWHLHNHDCQGRPTTASDPSRHLETKEAMRKFGPFRSMQKVREGTTTTTTTTTKTLNFDPPLYMSSKIGPHLSVWRVNTKKKHRVNDHLATGDQNICSLGIPSWRVESVCWGLYWFQLNPVLNALALHEALTPPQ